MHLCPASCGEASPRNFGDGNAAESVSAPGTPASHSPGGREKPALNCKVTAAGLFLGAPGAPASPTPPFGGGCPWWEKGGGHPSSSIPALGMDVPASRGGVPPGRWRPVAPAVPAAAGRGRARVTPREEEAVAAVAPGSASPGRGGGSSRRATTTAGGERGSGRSRRERRVLERSGGGKKKKKEEEKEEGRGGSGVLRCPPNRACRVCVSVCPQGALQPSAVHRSPAPARSRGASPASRGAWEGGRGRR